MTGQFLLSRAGGPGGSVVLPSAKSKSEEVPRKELWKGLVLSGSEIQFGGTCRHCNKSHNMGPGTAARWLTGLIMKTFWAEEENPTNGDPLHALHVALVRTKAGNTYVCYTGFKTFKVLESMILEQDFIVARMDKKFMQTLDPVPTLGGTIKRSEFDSTVGANKTLECAVPQALCYALLAKDVPIEVAEVFLSRSRHKGVLFVNWAVPCTTCQVHVPMLLCQEAEESLSVSSSSASKKEAKEEKEEKKGQISSVSSPKSIETGLVEVKYEVGADISYLGKQYKVEEAEEIGTPTLGWRYKLKPL